ncbi:6-bladed beta-propeller [Candidatus Palauibacter sp.]|uniref:6-bladed beta-propeller n=1 Tax=Candidatus Palauibacter sp. TaxID=3101350 RepID=UPI003CC614AC
MPPHSRERETMTRPRSRKGRWTHLWVLCSCWSLLWGSSTNALNGQVESWSLVDEMRLSGSDSLPFGRILSVVIGPDGSAFVTGTGDVAVHVLAPNGDYQGTVGGEGDGPGEFRTPPSIGIRSDTLWAIDRAQRRVNYFTLAGRSVGARRVPDALSARGLGMEPGSSLFQVGRLKLSLPHTR